MSETFELARKNMVINQLRPNKIKEESILKIFEKTPKENYLDTRLSTNCYLDKNLDITDKRGYLKNLHLAQIIKYSEVSKKDKVLHLGGLTGYFSALISSLCQELFVVEENIELFNLLKQNLKKIDVSDIHENLTGGIYALVLDSPSLDLSRYNGRPTQWFVRSDIGISLYRGANETVVQLQRFRDLDVPKGVKLDVISDSNRLLYSGVADDEGLLRIPNSYLNGRDGAAPAFLMSYSPDGDFSLLNLKGQQSGYDLKIGGAQKPHEVRRIAGGGKREFLQLHIQKTHH